MIFFSHKQKFKNMKKEIYKQPQIKTVEFKTEVGYDGTVGPTSGSTWRLDESVNGGDGMESYSMRGASSSESDGSDRGYF